MSLIKLQGNPSGTGAFTIASPSGNTDRTLTLPDITGTLVSSDASGNVGIGTSSPSQKLQVAGAVYATGDATDVAYYMDGSDAIRNTSTGGIVYHDVAFGSATHGQFVFRSSNAATERLRIDASGNVGIGTSSPSAKIEAQGNSTVASIKYLADGGSALLSWKNSSGTTLWSIGGGIATSQDELAFLRQSTTVAKFDSSGSLLVGTTDSGLTGTNTGIWARGALGVLQVSRSSDPSLNLCRIGTDGTIATFAKGATTVGNISVTGSATAYNTSSDYRLKENIAPMQNALATVARLNPVTYNWKADGSESQGFIAHELQAVVPECVTGEKDAMQEEQYEVSPAVPATYDDEGNVLTEAVEAVTGTRMVPAYQGIDTSFLVATLTKAIQEQQVMIQALQAEVAALKGASA